MPWTPALTEREKKASLRGSLQPKLAQSQMRLDKLPPGAVILDGTGHAWQQGKTYGITGYGDPYWYRAYGDDTCVSSFELTQIISGDFTIIHPVIEPTCVVCSKTDRRTMNQQKPLTERQAAKKQHRAGKRKKTAARKRDQERKKILTASGGPVTRAKATIRKAQKRANGRAPMTPQLEAAMRTIREYENIKRLKKPSQTKTAKDDTSASFARRSTKVRHISGKSGPRSNQSRTAQ